MSRSGILVPRTVAMSNRVCCIGPLCQRLPRPPERPQPGSTFSTRQYAVGPSCSDGIPAHPNRPWRLPRVRERPKWAAPSAKTPRDPAAIIAQTHLGPTARGVWRAGVYRSTVSFRPPALPTRPESPSVSRRRLAMWKSQNPAKAARRARRSPNPAASAASARSSAATRPGARASPTASAGLKPRGRSRAGRMEARALRRVPRCEARGVWRAPPVVASRPRRSADSARGSRSGGRFAPVAVGGSSPRGSLHGGPDGAARCCTSGRRTRCPPAWRRCRTARG